MTRTELLELLSSLRMAPAATGGRHPHKPLLLLWLLGQAQAGQFGPFRYEEVEDPVDELLAEFGTPAKRDLGRTAMPFFHLEDELWEKRATVAGQELDDARGRMRRAAAIGQLRGDVQQLLRSDPAIITEAARLLLDEHFTDSHVEPILGAVGIELDGGVRPIGRVDQLVSRRRRDPAFREATLRAYGYSCAMCGWDGALKIQPVGPAMRRSPTSTSTGTGPRSSTAPPDAGRCHPIGPSIAATLVDYFLPAGWADVAPSETSESRRAPSRALPKSTPPSSRRSAWPATAS